MFDIAGCQTKVDIAKDRYEDFRSVRLYRRPLTMVRDTITQQCKVSTCNVLCILIIV